MCRDFVRAAIGRTTGPAGRFPYSLHSLLPIAKQTDPGRLGDSKIQTQKSPPARLAREREPGARGGSNIEKHFGYRSNLTTDQIPCDKCKFTLGAATPPDEHRGCPSRQPRSIAAARAGLAAHGWRVRRRACGCKEVAGGVGWWKGSDGEKGTGGAWAAAWAAA